MKAVRLVLLLLMLLFMGLQYNDPDGLWWVLVYGVVAAALAASLWRPHWLKRRLMQFLLLALAISLAVAVWFYWPSQPHFWQQEVWWEEETAREGMGMMIAFEFLLFVLPVAFARGSATARDLDVGDASS